MNENEDIASEEYGPDAGGKFKVFSIENGTVRLESIESGNEGEDRFYESKEGISLVLSKEKPFLADFFKLGREFYIDFKPVD